MAQMQPGLPKEAHFTFGATSPRLVDLDEPSGSRRRLGHSWKMLDERVAYAT